MAQQGGFGHALQLQYIPRKYGLDERIRYVLLPMSHGIHEFRCPRVTAKVYPLIERPLEGLVALWE